MIAIDTKIQSLEDLARGENRFDDLKECVECELKVHILEGGLVSGRTSVSFICKEGDKGYVGQMTARQLLGLAEIVKAAMIRFGDDKR